MYGFTTPVQPVSEETARLVEIAQYILFAAAFINITSRDDNILILSAIASIIAIILLLVAVLREAQEQQPVPGQITPANRQKIIGTLLSLVANLILTAALILEVRIKRQTGVQQTFITGAQPATGAFAFGA